MAVWTEPRSELEARLLCLSSWGICRIYNTASLADLENSLPMTFGGMSKPEEDSATNKTAHVVNPCWRGRKKQQSSAIVTQLKFEKHPIPRQVLNLIDEPSCVSGTCANIRRTHRVPFSYHTCTVHARVDRSPSFPLYTVAACLSAEGMLNIKLWAPACLTVSHAVWLVESGCAHNGSRHTGPKTGGPPICQTPLHASQSKVYCPYFYGTLTWATTLWVGF